jgi:type II secretory pathway pseudopilin PulG
VTLRTATGRRTRRGAFTILQVLFALMLLGAFGVVAARVFRLSILSSQAAAQNQERDLRTEQALRALREDVWQSQTIDGVEPSRIRLTSRDGPIEWRTAGPDGDLVRARGKETRKWPALRLGFARQGRAILVNQKERAIAVLEQGVRR